MYGVPFTVLLSSVVALCAVLFSCAAAVSMLVSMQCMRSPMIMIVIMIRYK